MFRLDNNFCFCFRFLPNAGLRFDNRNVLRYDGWFARFLWTSDWDCPNFRCGLCDCAPFLYGEWLAFGYRLRLRLCTCSYHLNWNVFCNALDLAGITNAFFAHRTYRRLYLRNSTQDRNLFDNWNNFNLCNKFFFLYDDRYRLDLRQNLCFHLNARLHNGLRKIIRNCIRLPLGTYIFCAYNRCRPNLRLSCGVRTFNRERLWDWYGNLLGNDIRLFDNAWLDLCMSENFCECLRRTRFCSTCHGLSNRF